MPGLRAATTPLTLQHNMLPPYKPSSNHQSSSSFLHVVSRALPSWTQHLWS